MNGKTVDFSFSESDTTMEYDTYYYMHHPPTYVKSMLQDEDCSDHSIKEKYNQQLALVKEENDPVLDKEDQPSSSERPESSSIVIKRCKLDVNASLVDCLRNGTTASTTSTTSTQNDVPVNKLCALTQENTDTDVVGTKKTSKKYRCDICDKCFNQPRDLKRHLMVHSGKKPHVCSHCGKKFTAKGNLNRHVRTHTGEHPYSCDVCEYSCFDKSALTKHMLTHTGEKPYSCSQCEITCTSKHHLTVHTRTHTGEKLFSCDVCGKSFTRSSYFKQHKLTHTGEKLFSCSHCTSEPHRGETILLRHL